VRDGILVFYQDALAVFPDSGRQSLRTPTFQLAHIGKEMAAKASYIQRAKEVGTRR